MTVDKPYIIHDIIKGEHLNSPLDSFQAMTGYDSADNSGPTITHTLRGDLTASDMENAGFTGEAPGITYQLVDEDATRSYTGPFPSPSSSPSPTKRQITKLDIDFILGEYLSMEEAEKLMRDHTFPNSDDPSKPLRYYIDSEFSTEEHKVFFKGYEEVNGNITSIYRDRTARPVIVQRGSANLVDWTMTNVTVLIGLPNLLSPRFWENKILVNNVESKYNLPADAYGHSLGGALSESGGAKGNIMTYNKGAGILSPFKNIILGIDQDQVDLYTPGDIVSILGVSFGNPNKQVVPLRPLQPAVMYDSTFIGPQAPVQDSTTSIIQRIVDNHDTANLLNYRSTLSR
jgi:hypothetical protein